jgi:ADP-ribose pyrophosphatase
MNGEATQTLYQGRFLSLQKRGRWEFAARNTPRPAVGVVAVTDQQHIVLVEQHRIPAGGPVIELPAGLTGDTPGSEDEPLVEAARRELLEETGYVAEQWTELMTGYSSPGLTSEAITLFLARGLHKQGPGGGVEGENITVHEVPLREVIAWLQDRGARADFKVFAGLYVAGVTMERGTRD